MPENVEDQWMAGNAEKVEKLETTVDGNPIPNIEIVGPELQTRRQKITLLE